MRRYLIAPFVGSLLALSLAVGPVAAAPAPAPQVDSQTCSLLASMPLPANPFFVHVWHHVLDSLGCGHAPH